MKDFKKRLDFNVAQRVRLFKHRVLAKNQVVILQPRELHDLALRVIHHEVVLSPKTTEQLRLVLDAALDARFTAGEVEAIIKFVSDHKKTGRRVWKGKTKRFKSNSTSKGSSTIWVPDRIAAARHRDGLIPFEAVRLVFNERIEREFCWLSHKHAAATSKKGYSSGATVPLYIAEL